MTETVQRVRDGGVLVLRLDRPVANALVPEMRAALVAALDEAAQDAACRAVVIAGAGTGFSSGLDLSEDMTAPRAPTPGDLCHAMASCPKPVVAALHGEVAGAGLSLALAADARVAHEGTRLSLPEIALAGMPCAGATQRLPRLVGAQAALEMILSGRPVRADETRLRPLFDRVEADTAQVEPAARALALRLAEADPDPTRRDPQRGLSDPRGYQRAVATVRARLGEGEGAAADILRAVEAAQLLPLAQGLDFEEVIATERAQSREARALRHLRLAEGRARALPEMRAAPPRAVARVGLAGAIPAVLTERLEAAGVALVGEDPAERADLWIESEPGAAPAGPMRVTFDTGAGFGDDGLWLRFSPDAALAEIGVGPGAAAEAVAALAWLLARARLGVVRARLPAAGPGAGRLLSGALDFAALALLRAGLGPDEVDHGAVALGLAEGPCLAMDREGLDAAQARLAALAPRLDMPPPEPEGPLAARIARGARGRAVGRGFYEYPPEGPRPGRADGGAGVPQGVGAAEALHAALVNTAERMLADGVLGRPGDVDLLATAAPGMARDRGGPLFAADDRGLLAVLRDMKALAPLSEALWAPQPGIAARVREGQGYFRRSGAAAISRA
ncbi:enoyl-CoA hydratase/isomerase family protein [Roseovarius nitratireducens]|uniref:enoyl-CoA hydratase/isomerase family protein n=1 Tax=Roseovarius nitratireducens TaxID=2044597 RepID=UPI000CE20113|nr:enoyl-CoA hydratase/isomerase family protein [Roseovarius nitratireducens]